MKDCSITVPSYTSTLSNVAIPSTTLTDLSSVIPKTKDWPLNCLLVLTTAPFLRTIVGGAGETDEISQKKLTVAFAAFFDRGKYPIFLLMRQHSLLMLHYQ